MSVQLKSGRSTLRLAFIVLAIVLVAILVQYGQVFLTGSSPQPAVWVIGSIAVVIITLRAIARRR
jgi:hypothetical protein